MATVNLPDGRIENWKDLSLEIRGLFPISVPADAELTIDSAGIGLRAGKEGILLRPMSKFKAGGEDNPVLTLQGVKFWPHSQVLNVSAAEIGPSEESETVILTG